MAGSFKVAATAKTLSTKHSRRTAFKNVRIVFGFFKSFISI